MKQTFAPPKKLSYIPYIGNTIKYKGKILLLHQKLQEILQYEYLWSFDGFTHEYQIQSNKFHMALQIYKDANGYTLEVRNMLTRHRQIYIDNYNFILQTLKDELQIENVQFLHNIYGNSFPLSTL